MDQFNQAFAPPPPPPPVQPHVVLPRVRQSRISRACDRCHVRSTKCQPRQDGILGCQNCLEYGIQCTYDRPAKRRGMKPKAHPLLSNASGTTSRDDPALRDGESDARMLLELTNGPQGNGNLSGVKRAAISQRWKGMATANESQIRDLVEVYVELLYPMNPLFHIPTLRRRVEGRDYLVDESFFAEIMSICALSAAKTLDESLTKRWAPNHFRSPESATFFAAAEDVMPTVLEELRSLDYMRACAILALYGLHINKVNVFHRYMGIYISIVAMDGIQDEENWPKDIGIIEVEMRRRLFWSMYSLEVYTCVIFGNTIRFRENRTNVQYPSEVDDEFFSDLGYHPPNSLTPFITSKPITEPMCWMHGWNFVVDLYRTLEDCINHAPFTRTAVRFSHVETPKPSKEYEHGVLRGVISMFESLDSRFKHPKLIPAEENGELPDRFQLQAINIVTTLQLIRLVLFNSSPAQNNDKLAMASNVLEILAQFPTVTSKVVSAPQLYHFAGIAGLLKSSMQSPLSDMQCKLLGQNLTSLFDIFSRVEHEALTDSHFSKSIHDQIRRLTEYIENPENQNQNLQLLLPVVSSASSSSADANVDPSLQNIPTTTNDDDNMASPRDPFVAISDRYGVLSAVGGAGAGKGPKSFEQQGDPGGEHLEGSEYIYFQLPPEIVNGWPWAFDVSIGFGGSRN